MIAVDTNLLVYAHRADSPWNAAARNCIRRLAESSAPWAIPWQCIHEFLAIATHPKIYKPPTPLADAIEQVNCWLESPSLQIIGETDRHWSELSSMVRAGLAVGPLIHDARVAAVCRVHGVTALWSADRDFSRFPGLNVVNPLVAR